MPRYEEKKEKLLNEMKYEVKSATTIFTHLFILVFSSCQIRKKKIIINNETKFYIRLDRSIKPPTLIKILLYFL